jgi:hypothetical protein
MTLLLFSLFILGMLIKFDFLKGIDKWLDPKLLWRDLSLVSIILSSYIVGVENNILFYAGLPLAFLFLNFNKLENVETEVMLSLAFLLYPLTFLLKLDSNVPVFALTIFTMFYAFKERYKGFLIGTSLLAFFWLMVIKLPNQEVYSLLAPLGLILLVKKGLKSKLEPTLEYAFLLISTAFIHQMEVLPLWLKTGVGFLILVFLLLSQTSFVRTLSWSVLLIPLLVQEKELAGFFQLFSLLIIPIVREVMTLVFQEAKSFKVSGSNEVIMSYRQIVLLVVLILFFGGFRGTIFSVSFPPIYGLTILLFLVTLYLFLPLKEYLVSSKPLTLKKNEEVYFIIRTLSLFIVFFVCTGDNLGGYNFFTLSLAILTLSLGFGFRGYPEIQMRLRTLIQKSEISLGPVLKAEIAEKKRPFEIQLGALNFEKWHGYSYSFEISLVFLALLLLVLKEGV